MRLHVIGLPHEAGEAEYDWHTGFSERISHFCQMMHDRGHNVTLYSGAYAGEVCAEHVDCGSAIGVPEFRADDLQFAEFNARAVNALSRRLQPSHLLCLIGGNAQEPIVNGVRTWSPNQIAVEFGIGYSGTMPQANHVYESYAWMHAVYAQHSGNAGAVDGRFFDTVIPPSFDPKDFPLGEQGDYLLFVGRLEHRKGLQIALDTAEAMEVPLIVVGAGTFELPAWVDYRGTVNHAERISLMANARALMAPTLYLEPFGRVAVEAQMCGTPAITTDWGGFTETVEDGVSGFRCRMLRDFCDAVEASDSLDRKEIRARAQNRYCLEAIGARYELYFEQLSELWGKGFYAV